MLNIQLLAPLKYDNTVVYVPTVPLLGYLYCVWNIVDEAVHL